ncbi:MAG: 4Fe-4S binding protein [Spirochaetia bacterium]|nr:4Fe-4S binding protein [Spirochaetia bacterium]
MERQIITINEERCTGCGACVPDCPEGALRIIDGKARLVGDLFCDGLGACLGACPEDAIHVEVREADPYNERVVMIENIIPKGENTIRAHLYHLKDHNADTFLQEAVDTLKIKDARLYAKFSKEIYGEPESAAEELSVNTYEHSHGGGCPGSLARSFGEPAKAAAAVHETGNIPSELQHWPVQMHLINPASPHFRKSDFLLAADCTAFSMGGMHPELIKNHTLGIACPKLDDGLEIYQDKIIKLIDEAEINTLTVSVMEVPCCSGLLQIAVSAAKTAKRNIPVKYIKIGIKGEILQEQWVTV